MAEGMTDRKAEGVGEVMAEGGPEGTTEVVPAGKPEPKRSLWRRVWFYVVILVLVLFGAAILGGMWLGGSRTRSVAAVVDSYTAVYAGSDSTKDVPSLVALYASNAVLQDAAADRTYKGTTEIKAALDSLFATPKFDLTVKGTVIGSKGAVVKWTANGTKVDSGRLAQVSGVTVLEISDGKIMRETWYYDPAKAPF